MMSHFKQAVGLALLVVLLVATSPGANDEPDGKFYVVEMYDFYFDPPGLFVQPKDRVAWIMLEDHLAEGHSATAYHPDYDKELRIPEGTAAWTSGLLKQMGDSYEYTFEAVGVHDYFCIPHEDSGMVGRIIVKEATGPGTKPLSQGISPAGQSAMPTLEELTGPIGQIFSLQGRINAVVFTVRQSTRGKAAQLLDLVVSELRAGEGESGSLYDIFNRVNQWDAVLQGFEQLRQAIVTDRDLKTVQEIAESLKALLDEIVQTLSNSEKS